MNLSAVILAGGESRRMGRDKAWLEMGGQPLIRRALSTVRDSGIQGIVISGRAGADYSSLGCPVLFDLEPGCGPLGGIERALSAATAPLVLVLAVDLPGVTAAFLRKLAAHCDPLTGAVPKLRGRNRTARRYLPQTLPFYRPGLLAQVSPCRAGFRRGLPARTRREDLRCFGDRCRCVSITGTAPPMLLRCGEQFPSRSRAATPAATLSRPAPPQMASRSGSRSLHRLRRLRGSVRPQITGDG